MATKKQAIRNTFPCPLCKLELERRLDKKQKPYFVCDECGTQFFIRYRSGISRLEKLMQAPDVKAETRKLATPTASVVVRELGLIDDAAELWEEADQFLDPDSEASDTGLPFDKWIQQRTARIRAVLNLK